MSRRRGSASIVANPVLVGAVTTLVVIVAVFLAYNANNGLPFVPTRQLNVQISNGANLVKGNDVREGGFRVGVVEDMAPVRLPDGNVGAQLKLKLDKKVGALPVDTTVKIRPRSALGLKYVELERGTRRKTIPDGGLLPASQAIVPVELDRLYDMFDEKTRDGSRASLRGFGDAFAGRGYDLNRTIQALPSFARYLQSVTENLSDPRTDLKEFFSSINRFVRPIASVSKVNARLFTDMADTFEAISRDPEALKATITKNVSTLDVGTRSLRAQRPFLANFAGFSHDLRLATPELRAALPDLNSALKIGIPVTRASIQYSDDLEDVLVALQDLENAPTTNGALRGLVGTVNTLQPQLRYLGPFITVCNYWNTFWTFNAEHFSAPDPTGGSERAMLNTAGRQNDSTGSMGANEPANGKNVMEGTPQYLHGAINSAAVDEQGNADCEAGQRGYVSGRSKHGSPFYAHTEIDAHDNVSIGPTYKTYDKAARGHGLNTNRVPEGETFTRLPGGIGAQPLP
jgi:phospholipid/cholesterol/gamma-HCH transport system substrate-binding protein